MPVGNSSRVVTALVVTGPRLRSPGKASVLRSSRSSPSGPSSPWRRRPRVQPARRNKGKALMPRGPASRPLPRWPLLQRDETGDPLALPQHWRRQCGQGQGGCCQTADRNK